MQTLIVDDEEDMRVLLRTTIEVANEGLAVVGEASSGKEAIELWRTARPDAIVIDHRMPEMTGIEVCRAILAEQPDLPVVLFTAFLTDELRRTARDVGVRVCLSKDDVHRLPETLWGFAAA